MAIFKSVPQGQNNGRGENTKGNENIITNVRIIDPLLFARNYATYLSVDSKMFDFSDLDNVYVKGLFNNVIGSLGAALSRYMNDPTHGHRITDIQGDMDGFGKTLSTIVEEKHQWRTTKGIEIISCDMQSIEYNEKSRELAEQAGSLDALAQGNRANILMLKSVAAGMQGAGENGGGTGMAFMGMGMNAANGMMGSMQQPVGPSSYQPAFAQQSIETQGQTSVAGGTQPEVTNSVASTTKLLEAKKLLDAGAITEEDYNKLKSQILGI